MESSVYVVTVIESSLKVAGLVQRPTVIAAVEPAETAARLPVRVTLLLFES
jgi:hypothetical protein